MAVVLGAVVLMLGVGPSGAAGTTVPSVRNQDWKNGAYDLGDGQFAFSGGRHADLMPDGSCSVCLTISEVAFGDVDGDGLEEAILLIDSNLGGAATSLDAYVFGLLDGKPVLKARIPGGDRGEGGLQSVSVAGGDVVVRRFESTTSDGACCPSRVLVERWRWRDGKLLREPGRPRLTKRRPRPWYLRP